MKLKKLLNLLFELKITCSLQNGKFLEMNLLSLVLRLSDCFPKKGKQILSSFFGTVNTTILATKILLRNTLIQRSVKNPGKAFFRKISFNWFWTFKRITIELILLNHTKFEQIRKLRKFSNEKKNIKKSA